MFRIVFIILSVYYIFQNHMYYISNFADSEDKKRFNLPPLVPTTVGTAKGALGGAALGTILGRAIQAKESIKGNTLPRKLGRKMGRRGALILGGLNLGWNAALANSKGLREARAKDFDNDFKKKVKKPVEKYTKRLERLRQYGEYI